MTEKLLTVENLVKHYRVRGRGDARVVHAVDGVSFDLPAGASLGIVGESGCGKTTVARMVVRLTEPSGGRIVFEGRDITHLTGGPLRAVRPRMQIIFQDPYASLNPRHSVATSVAMPLRVNRIHPAGGIRRRVGELLELVGLNPDDQDRYPHEFSGGQRQRIGIARALATEPRLIVADEPVSALDVSIQAQIIGLLRSLQRELGVALVLIGHDLAVIRHVCQRVAVMYLGVIVEIGDRADIFDHPEHPYTRALLAAVPGAHAVEADRVRLQGEPASPLQPPGGCRFHTRCPLRQPRCTDQTPELVGRSGGQQTACHFPMTGPWP